MALLFVVVVVVAAVSSATSASVVVGGGVLFFFLILFAFLKKNHSFFLPVFVFDISLFLSLSIDTYGRSCLNRRVNQFPHIVDRQNLQVLH